MVTTKRSARVALYVNLRNPLHADEKHASEGIHRKAKTAVPVILRKCTTLFNKVLFRKRPHYDILKFFCTFLDIECETTGSYS